MDMKHIHYMVISIVIINNGREKIERHKPIEIEELLKNTRI